MFTLKFSTQVRFYNLLFLVIAIGISTTSAFADIEKLVSFSDLKKMSHVQNSAQYELAPGQYYMIVYANSVDIFDHQLARLDKQINREKLQASGNRFCDVMFLYKTLTLKMENDRIFAVKDGAIGVRVKSLLALRDEKLYLSALAPDGQYAHFTLDYVNYFSFVPFRTSQGNQLAVRCFKVNKLPEQNETDILGEPVSVREANDLLKSINLKIELSSDAANF